MRRESRIYIYGFLTVLLVIFFAPFFRKILDDPMAFSVQHLSGLGSYSKMWWNLSDLAKDNDELSKRIYDLLARESRMASLKEENNELRQMLDFRTRTDYKTVVGKVLSRTPAVLGQGLVIDRGLGDGIRENQAVISAEGVLIGKVSKVERDRSFIVLTSDPKSKVAGVSAKSRIEGIISGVRGISLSYDFVSYSAALQPGELILTSGLEDDIPPGILIGQVREVSPDEQGLFLKVDVSPAFDKLRLYLISIIVP